jgi:hypothetical protein
LCPAAAIGSLDKKWAADDDQQRSLLLGEIETRLAASDDMLRASMAPLVAKTEEVGLMAETAVAFHSLIGTCGWGLALRKCVLGRWERCPAVLL